MTYDDDSGDGNNFKITYTVTAGTLYYVWPAGYSGSGNTTVYISGGNPAVGGKTTGSSKLSLCLDRAKIFLEVHCDEFKKVWDDIFRDTYARHLRKKHNYSKKVAYEIFDRMLKEMAVLKNLRM